MGMKKNLTKGSYFDIHKYENAYWLPPLHNIAY